MHNQPKIHASIITSSSKNKESCAKQGTDHQKERHIEPVALKYEREKDELVCDLRGSSEGQVAGGGGLFLSFYPTDGGPVKSV